ncbi:hypothetical protein [Kingella sp. (in: b-proteobacteria)]|nr:hypothetical protein [Kingella sp. (in: b-proteobacteria)]MDO4658188.1 hypothetical protein [Kingella sp. (in: b-proteobacteria)]
MALLKSTSLVFRLPLAFYVLLDCAASFIHAWTLRTIRNPQSP